MSEATAAEKREGFVAEEDRIEGVDYCAGGWPVTCACGRCRAKSTIYGQLWFVRGWGLPVSRVECPDCLCVCTLTRPLGMPVVTAPQGRR